MSYTVKIAPECLKIVQRWAKSNPRLHKKLQAVLNELADHPRTGMGHPEALKGFDGTVCSRRLTANERIVYKIHDDVVAVVVFELGGHYSDK